MTASHRPGLRNQAGARTFVRVRVRGLVLTPLAFIGGLPLIGFGLLALQIGFLDAAARCGAGETMPVVRDSAAYLSDGQGILGAGRTVDDDDAAPAAGLYCRSCGVRNDPDAKLCDGCGTRLA